MRRLNSRSLSLGTYAGIPVKLHWSFALMLVWIPFLGWSEGMDAYGILTFSFFAIFLFGFVVLHEYGHALAARRYGIQTKDIILSPIGGIARLSKMPEKPLQELFVAIAGPLVNVALAILIGTIIYLKDGQFLPSAEQPQLVFNDWNNMLPMFFLINIVLVLFNMLPAFPMDGGRVLRALLSIPFHRLKATKIASIVGQTIAALFILYGLYQMEFVLPLIGIFVFVTARYEYKNLKERYRIEEATVEMLIDEDGRDLHLDMPISVAAEIMERTGQQHFLIRSQDGLIIAVLHGIFLKDAIEEGNLYAPVAHYASPRFEPIDATMPLSDVITLMNEQGYSILPVYKNDIYKGTVNRHSVQAWINQA